jgi:hypothetical protein
VLRLREGMQIFVKTLHQQGTRSSLRWRSLRQVSASHDKSPSPTSAWAQTHGSGEATNACGEANLHVTRGQQLATMQATCHAGALMRA